MKSIGKYQIIERIDSGGMGIVYKAMDPRIERVVAVKTLSARLDDKPELRKRLVAEARAVGILSHKNIVTIYEMDEDNGTAYLAMEFLDGNELNTVIAGKTHFALEQKLQIIAEVCEGLAHAHSMGVIHRDIKPANVFLTRSGQVKILDFGIAALVSSDAHSTGAGTLSYMSPEQVRGEKVDRRSDIFSTGVLFYELLTSRKPFQGESDYAVSYSICNADPVPVEQLTPGTPREVTQILARALAKNPDDRYQDVEQMLSDLNGVRDGIEQRKRTVRGELDQDLARLDELVRAHPQVLPEGPEIYSALKREYAALLSGSRQQGTTGSGRLPVVELRLLLELCERASAKRAALSAAVAKRTRTTYLLLEVEELRDAGRMEEALQLSEYLMQEDATFPDVVRVHEEVTRRVGELRSEAERRKKLTVLRASVANARAALGCGRLEAARTELQQALALDPDLPEHAQLLKEIAEAETQRRALEDREGRLRQLLNEARRRKESQDLPGALDIVQQILELDPANWYGMALREELNPASEQSSA